jgi:hypothetical protein
MPTTDSTGNSAARAAGPPRMRFFGDRIVQAAWGQDLGNELFLQDPFLQTVFPIEEHL